MAPYDFHAKRQEFAQELLTAGRQIINGKSNQFPGAVVLYQNQHDLMATQDGQEEFLKRYEELSPVEKAAFLRFSEFDWLADTASWKKAIINRPDDRENNPYHLLSLVQTLQAAGRPRDYVEEICHYMMIAGSGTNHPTGYLNEAQDLQTKDDGVDLYLQLIVESDVQKAAIEILDMDKSLPPRARATTLGEIVFGARYALRAINARNEALNQIIDVTDAVYGPREHHRMAPDFSRTNSQMDLAVRRWTDYDGKANAEYWTLLAEEAVTTYLSLSHHMWRLEQASAAIADPAHAHKNASVAELDSLTLDSKKIYPEMRPLYRLMGEIRQDLKEIKDEIERHHKELNDRAISSQERAERFRIKQNDFDRLFSKIGSLYDNRKIHDRTIKNDRGLQVYNEIAYEFTRLREYAAAQNWDTVAANHIINARRDLHADGLTLSRMEPRHNHLMNVKIVDNLFRHTPFIEYLRAHKTLLSAELRAIEKVNASKGFSNLPLARKEKILTRIEKSLAKTGILRRFMLEANPLTFDSNGYPDQAYGALRRLEIMEQYPLKHGPLFIVAESDAFGERLQKFIASDYRLDLMVHTALTEDQASMMRAHEYRARNHENGGQDALDAIKSKRVPAQFRRASGAAMLARSDISKDFGPLANLLVSITTALLTDNAAARKSPDIIKWGGGQSNNRGGGDYMEVLRIVSQRLQKWQRDNKQKLPPEVRAMAMSLTSTIQGRALYKSKAEIGHELKNQMAEMIGIWAELDGHIKEGTFIPQNDIINPDANEFLSHATEIMMKRYQAHRFAEGPEAGDVILDALALMISNSEVAAYTNNAARINARSGDKVNRQTKQRAIGNDIWTALSRTHHNGYFTIADFFELLHEAHHKGIKIKNKDGTERALRLSGEALRQILNSDKINYNLFVRSLSAAAQADFENGLKRLGALNQYSHQQIMDIAAACSVNKKGKFIQKGPAKNIDSKVAYFSTIYASAHKLRAFAGAVADDSFQKQPDVVDLINAYPPGKNPLRLQFNAAAKERWSFIERTQDYTKMAKPALLLTDLYERKIAAAKAGNGEMPPEIETRAVASLYRSTTIAPVAHVVLSYEYAYGRRREPLPEDPAAVVANQNTLQNVAA